MDKFDLLKQRISSLREDGLVRQYREIEPSSRATRVFIDGREVLMFCTNDYLGLARNPTIKDVMRAAIQQYGCGAGGSRYLGGTSRLHHCAEESIARFHGMECGVIYSNGYMANLGTISALARENDVLFSDSANHASIIDGCRLSRARVRIWNHNDPNHLRELLRNESSTGQKIVVFESLYSMDGDFAPVREILAVAREFDCITFMDEIHAVGVYGKHGQGYASELGIDPCEIDVLMAGTGKAFGALGGYIASSEIVSTAIKSQASPFIFTTAMPPVILAVILKALEIIQSDTLLRERLHRNAARLRTLLDQYGFDYLNSKSHIFPIPTGSTECTKHVCEALLSRGIYAQGVVYPSVPRGQGRLRITVMPQHTEDDLHYLVETLVAVRKSIKNFGVIYRRTGSES